MPGRSRATVFVPTEDFVADIDGAPRHFHAGVTKVREGHPILAGREHLFREIEVDYDVEEATDEPGRRRER